MQKINSQLIENTEKSYLNFTAAVSDFFIENGNIKDTKADNYNVTKIQYERNIIL